MRNFALRRILATAVALAAASGFAGCGGSSGSSSASSITPGPYGGPTSQGEGVGIVVAKDGKSVSAIAVKLSYSCPNGATEKDGSPSGPTSPVSLGGGSFSASWSAHGAAYKMSGAYRNGSFTGSLSGASAKCQSGKVNWSATPSTGTSTSSATSGGAPAKTALANAAHAYNTGAAAFNLAVRTDARARNLPAFKSDMAAFRNTLFQFDAAVRKIPFSASAQPLANALHSADRTEIADLDAIRSATSSSEALRLYAQVVKDNPAVIQAQQKLDAAL
jgi:hypothetical protein